VGWYSRETQSNQAVWPWWETPPTRGRKQATNEPNAISPHDLVVLLWCCAIAALLPWPLPLSHRKTLAPPFSLSHTQSFFSLYLLSRSPTTTAAALFQVPAYSLVEIRDTSSLLYPWSSAIAFILQSQQQQRTPPPPLLLHPIWCSSSLHL
jgi:hypothetical protein